MGLSVNGEEAGTNLSHSDCVYKMSINITVSIEPVELLGLEIVNRAEKPIWATLAQI